MSSTFAAGREAHSHPDQGPIFGGGGWYVAAFVFMILAGFIGNGLRSQTEPVLHNAGIIVMVIAVLPVAFAIVQVVRLFRAIGRAQLTTPDESLALGLATTATYVRPLRGGAALESVEARLQCEEEVTVGSGKNKRTLHAIVRDEELKPVPTPMPNELRMQIPVRIPENAPPSLYAHGAELRWLIRLKLKMRGCPDTRSSFVLQVLPAVVKR